MENINIIISVVINIITIIIIIFKFVTSYFKFKKVKGTEAEAVAKNELRELMNSLMRKAEEFYSNYQVMQSSGLPKLGVLKKDQVLTKMSQYCLANKINFDEEFWGKQIDDQINLSKELTHTNA